MSERLEVDSHHIDLSAVKADEHLQIVKREFHERSRGEGELVEIGTLSGGENQHLWTGVISLQQRLESGEITEDELEKHKRLLAGSFVPATPGASKRCGDGSSIAGYDDNDPEWYGRPLGPQIFGGTAGEANARRLLKGFTPEEKATLADDVETEVHESKSKFAPGDHTDDRATGHKTGCGQIDGNIRKQPLYSNPENIAVMSPLARALFAKAHELGMLSSAEPPKEMLTRLQQSALELEGHPEIFRSRRSSS